VKFRIAFGHFLLQGTGLGFSLSDDIVKSLEGEIKAATEGKGGEFIILIWCKKAIVLFVHELRHLKINIVNEKNAAYPVVVFVVWNC